MFFSFSLVGFHMEEGGGREYGVLFFHFLSYTRLVVIGIFAFWSFQNSPPFLCYGGDREIGGEGIKFTFLIVISKPASCC